MSAAALPLPFSTWRHFFWRRPEWWALSLSAAAWIFLTVTPALEFSVSSLTSATHVGHTIRTSGALPLSLCDPWAAVVFHWPLMIAAMMLPPLIGQLRFVGSRSLWFRRDRAMCLFLVGYSSLWLLFGLLAETVLLLPRSLSANFASYVTPAGFVLAALWQLSPQKRRSLVACHSTAPLAPAGWRADSDCFRHGLRIASTCCASCWALMLACAASGHTLPVMLVVTLIVWFERSYHPRSRHLYTALTLSAVALLCMATT